MDASKVKTEDLIESFQKLGDAHRALKSFAKENKTVVSKQVLGQINTLVNDLEDQQKRMIDFAFDSVFRKKGKQRT